jgi:hypothetical protein
LNLQSLQIANNRRPDLICQLGGGVDELLLCLNLLLLALDRELVGLDFILLGLEPALEVLVVPACKEKPYAEKDGEGAGSS